MSLILCGLLASTFRGYSDVTVKVDSTQPWLGYMNVWETNGTTYAFGSAWATADLRAAFVPANSPSGWPLNTALVLRPNTNTYNPADIYWNNPDGSPNKVLEANFYRDVGHQFCRANRDLHRHPALKQHSRTRRRSPGDRLGSSCRRQGFLPSYGTAPRHDLGSPHYARRVHSEPEPFLPGQICQWGFIVKGPNTAPLSANSLTGVGILVEDSDPAITNQPASLTITSTVTTNLSVGAIGSGPLTYQWKTNGVNLVNGAKFTGVDSATLTINNAQVADSGAYVVTVSNTVTHTTVDSTPAQLTVLDILITASPVNQRVEQGSTAVFSVTATSSSSLTYLWRSVINGVTNFAARRWHVGVFTATLTLSNVQPAKSGFYFVTITAGSRFRRTAGATLLVKTYAEYANFLENPGFENDTNGVDESPWDRFEVTDPGTFGHFQSIQ